MQPITGIPWLDALLAVLSTLGYPAVFIAGALENLFIVGSFMPGETIVTTVAVLASRDPSLNIYVVFLVSVLGTTFGSNVSYAIGRIGGRPMLDRLLGRFPRMAATLDESEHYFEMHGSYTVVLARFTAGFKNFVPALAGVGRMNLWVFNGFTLVGAVIYSAGLCIIGYFFGERIDEIFAWFKTAGVWVAVVFGALIAAYVAYRIWRHDRIEHQVEAHIAIEEAETAPVDPDAESGEE